MQVAPELQILILNVVILGVAYLGIYPSLQKKTIERIMVIDLILTALALLVAGGWFLGADVGFSLLVIETNWWLFTLLTLFTIELPLFLWFAKKHDISLTYDPDKDE